MNLITRTIEDLDGLVTNDYEAAKSSDITADDVINDFGEYDDTQLLTLQAETLKELENRIEEVKTESLEVFSEIAQRVRRNNGLIRRIDDNWEVSDAWRDLGYTAREEWRDRHNVDRRYDPMPRYEHTTGIPSSIGAVSTRILKGWVVEVEVFDAEKRHPDVRTVTGEVTKNIRISHVDPQGFSGRLHDEPAWILEGLGEDENERFAIAPIEVGEDLTMWVYDSFNEEWDNPLSVGSIQTWPNKYMYEN